MDSDPISGGLGIGIRFQAGIMGFCIVTSVQNGSESRPTCLVGTRDKGTGP